MNEFLEKLYDDALSAWRYRWVALAVAAVVFVVGSLAVFTLPDRYEASASVFVDTQTALRPMLQGLAVDQDVNVQLNYVRQALLSGERLERIARSSGVLPPTETDPKRISAILRDLSSRVRLEVGSAGNQDSRFAGSIYRFKYQDTSRERSLKVVDTVVNNFVEETLGGKRASVENAQLFVERQLKELAERLSASENRIAEFKKANVGLLPTEGQDYVSQLQQTIDEARSAENELQIAVSRREELRRQLRGDAVVAATAVAAGGGANAGSDTVTRINQTQALIDELLLKFTEKHPSVIEARRTLEELYARRAAEIEQLRQGNAAAAATTGVSTNPVYQQIRMQLNQAEVEVASLRGRLTQLREKAEELRKRLDTAPKVAAEYAQLTRDDEVLRAQYNALLANLEKAQLGERADQAGSVRFEVVQPVDAPYDPVFPPRILLLAGSLFAGLGFGGALAWVLHMLRPVVTSTRSLAQLTDLPVLGVVSPAFPSELAARARHELWRFSLAGAALVGAFVVAVAMSLVGFRISIPLGGLGA